MRASLVLLVAVLLVFGASLASSFHFDDYAIFSDPSLHFQTRPLTWLTFWVNQQLGGKNPVGYHAVNLALHICAVLLLFSLLPGRAAFIAAVIFALHPIQSEAVLYVFARGTLLATVFCLLSLHAWRKEQRWLAVVWFALALLSKEECAAFPLFLLLRKGDRRIFLMLGLSAIAGLHVIYATSVVHGAGAGLAAGISPLHYLANQGWVIMRYLRLLVVPWGFNVDPDIHLAAWQQWIGWILLLGLVALAVKRRLYWFLGGLILLLPSSSIFPAADLAADRRMYLPMVGFAAAAGFLLSRVNPRILIPIALLLAALSFGRTRVWRSEESLWSETVRLSPGKVRPKIQLARALDPHRALGLLEEARRIAPDDPAVASELGRTYLELGDPARALAEFGRQLALDPGSPGAMNNRGAALLALGQTDAARQDFERALQKDPCLFDARFNLRRLGVETTAPPQCQYTPDQAELLR